MQGQTETAVNIQIVRVERVQHRRGEMDRNNNYYIDIVSRGWKSPTQECRDGQKQQLIYR